MLLTSEMLNAAQQSVVECVVQLAAGSIRCVPVDGCSRCSPGLPEAVLVQVLAQGVQQA